MGRVAPFRVPVGSSAGHGPSRRRGPFDPLPRPCSPCPGTGLRRNAGGAQVRQKVCGHRSGEVLAVLRPVVVGLDGSRESLAAADWAAGEALRRGRPLRLVHAWEGLSPDASSLPELEAPRYWAQRILRGAMDQLNERHPQVRLSAEQIARPAADALVAAGGDGELLVLGSRAFSGLGGFLAGSVALATVARVTRPVVLVRADRTAEDDHAPDEEGRPSARTPYRDVVVGVDTAQPCEELLAFAFETRPALMARPIR
ncbi:universal stress protein [Streptomyces sp. NBC_00201]|nr:universal stress protein [Streptomyces sp. NBC_00201]